jgi:hypothetical protein
MRSVPHQVAMKSVFTFVPAASSDITSCASDG